MAKVLTKQNVHKSYSSRSINRERLNAILKYSDKTVLDVGCGSGAYVNYLATEYQINGIDYKNFDSWKNNPERFIVSDASDLKCSSSQYETIISFETLEHLDNPRKVLEEFYRVADKNIIITVPNCQIPESFSDSNLIYNHWKDPTHVNFWTKSSILELVESCGFKIIELSYINYINPWPLLFDTVGIKIRRDSLISRLFFRILPKKYPMTILLVAEK
jgi:ubiquinone/menaquinone biosynthesis C-methylase UbiE